MSRYFPLFVDLEQEKIVVVGAGPHRGAADSDVVVH